MQPSSTGLLLDTRPAEQKEFKRRTSEVFTSPAPRPFSYFPNRDAAIAYVGKFPLENQQGENSCVAHSRALNVAIYRNLIKGQPYIQPSPAFIYKLRTNAPQGGMIAADANTITEISGVPAYADFPDLPNDASIDATPLSPAVIGEAKKNTVKAWLTSDIPNNIDLLAGISNGLGIASSFLTYATIEEWSLATPQILVPTLDQYAAPVRHCITVLPQSAYTGTDGKRYVIIQDSAFFGGLQFRDVSDDWIAQRCLRFDYIADLENVASGRLTPYTFNADLSVGSAGPDVVALQKALQELGFFPSLFNGVPFNPTGSYYGITKQAVLAFQNAHLKDILEPAGLTEGTGYAGAATRAYLNKILNA